MASFVRRPALTLLKLFEYILLIVFKKDVIFKSKTVRFSFLKKKARLES